MPNTIRSCRRVSVAARNTTAAITAAAQASAAERDRCRREAMRIRPILCFGRSKGRTMGTTRGTRIFVGNLNGSQRRPARQRPSAMIAVATTRGSSTCGRPPTAGLLRDRLLGRRVRLNDCRTPPGTISAHREAWHRESRGAATAISAFSRRPVRVRLRRRPLLRRRLPSGRQTHSRYGTAPVRLSKAP